MKLVFHCVSGVQCNNHAVVEIDAVPNCVERRKIGVALFPTVASVLNHSCDPNTATVMVGNRFDAKNFAGLI